LKQQFGEIWLRKGSELLEQEKYEEARVALSQATMIKPGLAQAWYNLARICAIEGSKSSALSHLRKAIESNRVFKDEAKIDEKFQSLRDDPDFRELIA